MKTQTPLLRIKPSAGRCEREIGLRKSGKSIPCRDPSYVSIQSVSLCVGHFLGAMTELEDMALKARTEQ